MPAGVLGAVGLAGFSLFFGEALVVEGQVDSESALVGEGIGGEAGEGAGVGLDEGVEEDAGFALFGEEEGVLKVVVVSGKLVAFEGVMEGLLVDLSSVFGECEFGGLGTVAVSEGVDEGSGEVVGRGSGL